MENIADFNLIHDTIWALTKSRTLQSGIDLNVFDHIHSGCNSVEALVSKTQASTRGMQALLDGLTVLGFLEKQEKKYSLSNASSTFLVSSSPTYVGDFVNNVEELWEPWGNLTKSIQEGGPVVDRTYDEVFFQTLVTRLFSLCYPMATMFADQLGIGSSLSNLKIFDVASGSSPWGIAFAQADSGATVLANDFPGVLEVAKRHAEKFGVADRFSYLPGDIKEIKNVETTFDLVILGHICHGLSFDDNQQLIQRAYSWLKPNGKVLIADLVCDDNRSETVFPVIFALNMLVLNQEGSSYTESEYRQWLSVAGFKSTEFIEIPTGTSLFLGTK
ncbi:MAG: methyltransferase [Methylococcales bacterium]